MHDTHLVCIAIFIAMVAPIIATVIFVPVATFLWAFGRYWAIGAGPSFLVKQSASLLGVCVALGWVVEGGLRLLG